MTGKYSIGEKKDKAYVEPHENLMKESALKWSVFCKGNRK